VTGRGKAAALSDALDKLEARYGKLVVSDDPIEAGVLTLLAMHAPKHATQEMRDRLRESFVDWNEMRVCDPWDVTTAMEAGTDPEARAFARAALRFLESVSAVLHRTSLDALKGEVGSDAVATIEKMRGAPPAVRAVVLAVLDTTGAWHPGAETVKVMQKLGVVSRTASTTKAGKEAQENAGSEDRLRAHYLLTRYATREKEEDDPLEGSAAKRPAKTSGGEKKPRAAAPKKAAAAKE
jgi:hypothetical protein